MDELNKPSDFLFYTGKEGNIKVQIILGEETVWATQKTMGEIFRVDVRTISEHLQNIFGTNELDENSVIRKVRITASDNKVYLTNFYSLDGIIAVGYRVNSYQATQFRIWATQILKEYLIKGFALDDERLKQGKKLFGKDYFDELLTRVREIRASERRFYQKITDLYAQCSVDYDKNSPITKTFFATVQNKLEFAITHKTAAEIIKSRAKCSEPNMGLTTWSNALSGKITKKDVTVAKNYLSEVEIGELNSVVNMYLDYAELQAKRQRLMKMQDWVDRLDVFLKFNEYDILNDSGKIRKNVADAFAEKEYEKFRVIQDKEYKSDFDDSVEEYFKSKGTTSKEFLDFLGTMNKDIAEFSEINNDSTFDQIVDVVLKFRKPQVENNAKLISFGDAIRTIGKAGKPKE